MTCSKKIKELFFELLKFRSITPNDDGALDFIEKQMVGFKSIRVDVGDVKNLFLYRDFGEGKHLCFAGHVDVVPAGDGWMSEPYEPVEKDGFVYARGTQDMKSGVCASMVALLNASNFKGRLSLLLTSDEEGDAIDGTVRVLEYLKERDMLPDFAIVAEPTCEDVFGDSIKVGRRGSINGVVEIFGVQGHVAYPEKSKNTIHLFSTVLPQLADHFFDEGDEDFAPSRLVITDIRSGMQVSNVTPGYLKLMFNVRNSTKTTKDDVERFVESKLKGLDFKLKLTQGSFPFVTNRNSMVVKNMYEAIEKVVHVKSQYSTAGGTSDARMFAHFGVEVVEFGVRNDTIHAPNERTSFKEVEDLCRVFSYLVNNFKESI